MALIDNDTQLALTESVRRLVADQAPPAVSRAVALGPEAYDTKLWGHLVDLGLSGLTVPESYGGSGGTYADLLAVQRELGAGLVPSPLLATTVLAAGTLRALDDEAARTIWLPRIAAGEVIAALAVSEPGVADWIPSAPAARATRRDGRWLVTGTKRAVINGGQAGVVLVHAGYDNGFGIFLLEHDAPGLVVTAEDNVDHVRSSAAVTLRDTPAVLIEGDASAALETVADVANLAVAAEQSAAMFQALHMTVDYAKIRYSFGQPIGSYQGVKHKLADLYTRWSLVDAALRRAVEATDASDPDASVLATAARVLSSPAYLDAAKSTMLLHGGIGYTWEHQAHLFYKNAIGNNSICGDSQYQLRRLSAKLDLRPAVSPALR